MKEGWICPLAVSISYAYGHPAVRARELHQQAEPIVTATQCHPSESLLAVDDKRNYLFWLQLVSFSMLHLLGVPGRAL